MTTAGARGDNIVLIGFRGSGKTTVGRALAERLGRSFVDTDEQLVARAGCDIRTVFETHGEPAFRALEREVVATVATGSGRVISVGGGAVLAEENRAALRAAGVCVWLTAPAEVLAARIAADPQTATQRPALIPGVANEVVPLLAQRSPLYAALADLTLDTQGRSVADLVDELLAYLQAHPVPADSN